MKLYQIDPGAEIAAWIAAAAGVYALGRQIWEAFKKNRKEKSDINQALDRSPEVRQQLELGNVGAAVNHLNSIIESQARDLQRRQMREEELEQDLDEARVRADRAEDECRTKEADVERERTLRLKAENDLTLARRNYARAMAQLRNELAEAEQERGEET